MLICPQCQFENPNTNKFCQRCGTSLTHKVCPECGTNVALNEKRCQNCGTMTGTVWWAIISRELESPKSRGKEEQEGEEEFFNGEKDSQGNLPTSLPLAMGAYLDQEHRYKLLESLPPLEEIPLNGEVQVRVLDCQPFQVSPLAALTSGWQESPSGNPQLGDASTSNGITLVIAKIAKAYLSLESEVYQMVPHIHDVWQYGGIQVILIEDRSDWLKLNEQWEDDQNTSFQEILHWLYQMAQLWGALEPWNCRQSLLESSNLRVDEDQALVLQRLYTEPENGESLTLKDLGKMWQRLFQESQRTQFGSLVQMLQELQSGDIQNIEELRSRLAEIANEMQVMVNSNPDSFPLESNQAPESFSETDDTLVPATSAPTVLQQDEPEDGLTKSDDVPTIVLPMQLISLEDAGRTDVGRQRHQNEDFFGIETAINKLEFPKGRAVEARGLYILCDGMGGHASGEVASTLAVKSLKQYFQTHWVSQQLPDEDVIREAVLLANQAIYDVNQKDARSGIGRMGTTLVLVLIQDTQVAVAHVGDSRLYRLTRKRGLEQVTMDHEVGQREILRGVDPAIAYARADAYQLTQALGPRDENFINPDVQFLELNEDTLLILASDGLSDNDLLENHWHTHLEPLLSSRTSLERGVSDLVDLANQYNGHDNITSVVIRAKVRPNLEQPLA